LASHLVSGQAVILPGIKAIEISAIGKRE